jgi:hypothetical protein
MRLQQLLITFAPFLVAHHVSLLQSQGLMAIQVVQNRSQ